MNVALIGLWTKMVISPADRSRARRQFSSIIGPSTYPRRMGATGNQSYLSMQCIEKHDRAIGLESRPFHPLETHDDRHRMTLARHRLAWRIGRADVPLEKKCPQSKRSGASGATYFAAVRPTRSCDPSLASL
jgi:hypothetical protein